VLIGQYAAKLRELIAAHRIYPEQSLRRGEEGSVKLRIVLTSDGGLIDVHALSDAPSRLVTASLQAVRASAPFPPLPPALGASRNAFEVSVVYKIQ
jgi:TonB family protein